MSIRRHTAINIGGALVPMAVMFITVPIYLKVLGESRYGVLAIVWAILGYFGFMDLGLGRATANSISKTADNAQQRSQIFWSAILANFLLGVLAGALVWLLGYHVIGSIIKIPPNFRAEALQALPWMAATFPLALVSSVLIGALEARGRFLEVNIIQVGGQVIFQVAPLVAAMYLGPGLEIVIPVAVVSRVVVNVPMLIACRRYVTSGAEASVRVAKIRELLAFGSWVALSGMASPILETFDRFLIGAILGAREVSYYVIPFQLLQKLRIIPGSLARATFPSFSANNVDTSSLANDAIHKLMALMTPLVVSGFLLLDPFMRIWLGEEIAAHTMEVGYLCLVGVFVNSIAYVPMVLIQGRGQPGLVARIHLCEIPAFLVLVYFMTHSYGLIGAAAAWVLRVSADTILLVLFSDLGAACIRRLARPVVLVVGAYGLIVLGALLPRPMLNSMLVALLLAALWYSRTELISLADGVRIMKSQSPTE